MLMICLAIMLTFTGCGSSNKSASSPSNDGYNEVTKEEPRINDTMIEEYPDVTIYLKEVRETKVVEENNFMGDVKTAFRESIDGLASFFQGLVILLVRFWFSFLMMILIVLIIILLIKRAEKRAAKRRLERGMNPAPHGYAMPYAPENLNGNANQTEEQKANENKE